MDVAEIFRSETSLKKIPHMEMKGLQMPPHDEKAASHEEKNVAKRSTI